MVRRAMVLAFVLLTACSGHAADTDQLSLARKRLRPTGCAATPAVAAVSSTNADSHRVYLGDWVVVSVCHLQQLLATADAAQVPLTLYVEGRDTGNEPAGIDIESGTLTFILERNEGNRDLWRPFLYDPLFDPEVSLRLSVGMKGERPLPRTTGANMTIRLRKVWVDWSTWLWLGMLAAIAVVILLAAARTDMLRDRPATDGVRHTYSLARSQMAWWFFLTVISYSFIWLITGDRDTIPPSLLGLMGISAATALVAAAIPDKKETVARSSKSWWRDIVEDESGAVALDRLQIVVWTVVLSGIFLTSVVWELTMPEFGTTLLALMGISSGTYVGFKLPHKASDT